jgi:septal ring factor EnvC (AmiA/AmiB activator)
MRCGAVLRIFVLALLLGLLASPFTYSLNEEETAELTAILTELNKGLTKIESGLDEASEEQKKLERELNVLGGKTKELERELHEQKRAQIKLEAQLEDLSNSYERIQRKNKVLTWVAGGAIGVSLAAGIIVLF